MKWRIAPLRIAGLLTIVGINVVLLVEVTTQIMSDDPVTVDKVDWNAHLSGSVASAAGRKPLEAYGEILAHPVFFKSRQPFVPPSPKPTAVAVAPPPVVVDPGLVVGGVMIKNGLNKAYLLSRAGGGGAWATEGEAFQGWKVTSVDKSGVKLEQSGRFIDLQLYPRD